MSPVENKRSYLLGGGFIFPVKFYFHQIQCMKKRLSFGYKVWSGYRKQTFLYQGIAMFLIDEFLLNHEFWHPVIVLQLNL